MADISLKIIADRLEKSLEGLPESIESELNNAVKDVAYAAHANIIADIQRNRMSPMNRKQLLSGLQLDTIGDNSYVISLNGEWANKLEDGFPAYDMKETLLNSTKRVSVGSRAGEPWVQKSKSGFKYASVPFEHKPYGESSGDLAQDLKSLTARNLKGREQKITKTFKDINGNPLQGKVATSLSDNPLLNNLTKYQHVSNSGRVSSIYVTYRTISELSNGWQHPGFEGWHFFEQAEKYVEDQLAEIVRTLL